MSRGRWRNGHTPDYDPNYCLLCGELITNWLEAKTSDGKYGEVSAHVFCLQTVLMRVDARPSG